MKPSRGGATTRTVMAAVSGRKLAVLVAMDLHIRGTPRLVHSISMWTERVRMRGDCGHIRGNNMSWSYRARKRRELFKAFRGKCFWCGCETVLDEGAKLDNSATTDHLIDRWHFNRCMLGITLKQQYVLACRRCNSTRNEKQRYNGELNDRLFWCGVTNNEHGWSFRRSFKQPMR